MARDPASKFVQTLDVGQVDGPDATDIPDGAFWSMSGFNMEHGYPRTEYGRELKTAAQIKTGAQTLCGVRWNRETGSVLNVVFCNGILWKEGTANSFAFNTPMNIISDGVDSGTITTNTVTPSSTAKLVGTLQVGDKFYFAADGVSKAKTISAITAASFTVASYAGSSTAGAYKIVRYLGGTEVDIVPAGGRLFVSDGVNRLHWYGSSDGAGAADIFRKCGIAPPSKPPTVTRAATGGLLATGSYKYAVCFEDARGAWSNPVYSQVVETTNATEKVTIADVSVAPSWVTRVRFFKSIKNLPDTCYYFPKDEPDLHYTSIATSGGSSVVTLAASLPPLVADAHISRYATFRASGTKYKIKDNASNTVTFSGATVKSAEAATGYIDILNGFDYDDIKASGYVDVTDGDSLDLDIEAPTENDEPPTKLKHLHLFRGGGRLVAVRDDTQTQAYFSGRTDEAPTEDGVSSAGEGEFDYWPISHFVGNVDGDEVMRFASLGPTTFALKKQSIWYLEDSDQSVDNWGWFPVQGCEGVGCYASYSVARAYGLIYFLGHDGEYLDVIRFDGQQAMGMMRHSAQQLGGPRSRVFMDTIITPANAMAMVYKGRLLVSVTITGQTVNTRTIDYDLKGNTLKIQPWGCGRFWPTYRDASGNPTLLCCAPTAVGYVYTVFGTAADVGSNIARELITKQFWTPEKRNWSEIRMRVINGQTLTTAPVVSYYIGSLSPESASWETTLTGDSWPTTVGQHDIVKRIEAGERANQITFKISATDAKDWGVKAIGIEGYPYKQKAMG